MIRCSPKYHRYLLEAAISTTQVFKSGAAVIAGSSGFNLDGLSNIRINTGLTTTMATGAGQVSPSFIASLISQPTITFDCTDIATCITNGIKETPLSLPTSTTYTTLTLYATKTAESGTIAGASSHMRIVINKAIVVMKGIRCSINEHAKASIEVHALYDGTNAPFVITTGVSLPHTPIVDEVFTVGSGAINGSSISSVVAHDWDFGINITKVVSDGDLYPSHSYIDTIDPKVTLTMKDASVLNTYSLVGTAQGSTASQFYLRKMTKGGTRVADNSTVHIKLLGTASEGMIYTNNVNLNATDGEAELVVCFTTSGSSSSCSLSIATIT